MTGMASPLAYRLTTAALAAMLASFAAGMASAHDHWISRSNCLFISPPGS